MLRERYFPLGLVSLLLIQSTAFLHENNQGRENERLRTKWKGQTFGLPYRTSKGTACLNKLIVALTTSQQFCHSPISSDPLGDKIKSVDSCRSFLSIAVVSIVTDTSYRQRLSKEAMACVDVLNFDYTFLQLYKIKYLSIYYAWSLLGHILSSGDPFHRATMPSLLGNTKELWRYIPPAYLNYNGIDCSRHIMKWDGWKASCFVRSLGWKNTFNVKFVELRTDWSIG